MTDASSCGLQNRNKWSDILIWALIGIAVFISIYGLLPLDVTYDRWIFNGYVERDVTQHYAGWLAFRQSAWHLPLGRMDGLGRTILTYTDSIPWASIFFKSISSMLPETFQFFGLYVLACFILQGIATGMLLKLFTEDSVYIFLGVLLFCYSPIMIERAFRHVALASHWLLVFMIYFYFKARKECRLDTKSIILPVLAIGIHPYFLPTVFGLMLGSAIELFITKRSTIKRSTIIVSCALVATVFAGYLIGALGTSSSLGGWGFGHFCMNLNALVNPISCSKIVWSRFLKVLPQMPGNYDGFNYLGLGVIVMSCISFVLLILKPKVIFSGGGGKQNVILILLCIGFSVFAVSNVIKLNGEILFTYPLPKILFKFVSIFRASSRIFYPVYYLIILFGITQIRQTCENMGALSRTARQLLSCFLLLLVVMLQLADISPALKVKYDSFDKASIDKKYESTPFTGSKIWNSIIERYSKIKMLNRVGDYKLAAFGEKHHMAPDVWISGSTHFTGGIDLSPRFTAHTDEIIANRIDKNSVYVTSDSNIAALLANLNPEIIIYKDSGYYEIVREALPFGERLSDKKLGITVDKLSDKNWANGVSKFENGTVLLFRNSNLLRKALSNNNAIIDEVGQKFRILSSETKGKWIHVKLDKDARSCEYPHIISLHSEIMSEACLQEEK